jgi:hypothetical protein
MNGDKIKKVNAVSKVAVGDIFINTWGYDQTNADFWQVVWKTAKGLKLRRINSREVETGFMCGRATPIKDSFVNDKEVLKYPEEYIGDSCLSGTIWINFEYGAWKLWDGKPVSCSWYA